MKSKKLFTLFSLVIAASMLLASCGGTATTPSGTTGTTGSTGEQPTLQVWITWGDNPQQLQALFDRFGVANNVKVIVTAPVEQEKILTALSSSTPPDVLILSGGDYVKTYNKEGLIEPLNSYITSNNINIGDIFPAPLDQCKQGDTYLCLPWGTDVYALYWNKDLFENAGLDPNKPPSTMEELVSYADKLTIANPDGTLKQIGFIPDFEWSHIDLYARMFGGLWFSPDGTQMTVNSQPMLDAMNWETQFYTKYGVQNVLGFKSALGGYMSPDEGFYAGKVAMLVDGEWQVGPNFISKLKPELNYGVGPFPAPKDHPERANTVVVQGTVALIPSGGKNKDLAAKLLAWMESPDILAEEMYTNANLPTSKTAAADPRFKNLPNFQVFLDLIANPNASYIITTPITQEVVDKISQIEAEVMTNGGDAKALLDAAQADFVPKLQDALK